MNPNKSKPAGDQSESSLLMDALLKMVRKLGPDVTIRQKLTVTVAQTALLDHDEKE